MRNAPFVNYLAGNSGPGIQAAHGRGCTFTGKPLAAGPGRYVPAGPAGIQQGGAFQPPPPTSFL